METQYDAIVVGTGVSGGRAAEEIIFGKDHVTSGASNDILQATNKARAMVVEWGMSDKLGPLKYTENEEVRVKNLALRRDYIQQNTSST